MSKKAGSKRRQPQAAEPVTTPVRETRVDAAHVIDKPEPESAGPPESCQEAAPPLLSQEPSAESRDAAEVAEAAEAAQAARQLRLQADQLAEYLRARQRELNHREAELNARCAQWENESRTARLMMTERQAEWERRLATVKAQQSETENRLARLAEVESNLKRRQLDAETRLADREEQLSALAERLDRQSAEQENAKAEFLNEQQRRVNELRAEKQRIDVRREASLQLVRQLLAGVERHRVALEAQAEHADKQAVTRPLLAQNEELVERLQTVQIRQQQLHRAESELAHARAEVEQLRGELLEQRDKDREAARADRQRMALEHRRALAELDQNRQALARRGEQLDQNWAALEQLRNELGRMHRETLEIRLATEELWVQLAGSAPPAAITHSLGQIRSRLADDYRMANAELAGKKQELQSLYDQLADQHEKLRRHKEQIQRWSVARQDEIQKQAERLVAREQQLDAQEAQFTDMARRWESERLDYQQEIRRLRAQLAGREAVQVAS